MGLLDDVKTAEDAESQAVQSVITFIQGLEAKVTDLTNQIAQLGGNPAAGQALIAEIQANTAALQKASTATP